MPNIRFVIEYDGAAFHGWQMQDGVPTVQSELGRAIETVLQRKIEPLHAAGRTDAGVHARGQVVTMRCDVVPELPKLAWGVSSLLRGKLSILSAESVPEDFHPRVCAISKQYSYRILNRRAPAIFERGRMWEIPQDLNLDRMGKEARTLIGEHDFSSLRDSQCKAKSAVRTIFESEVLIDGPHITIRLVGTGFLRYMVRIIAGTLVAQSDGSLAATMVDILKLQDRSAAGMTAPAHGLCLDWVKY